ncbi:MAG: hypothetical protein NVS1B14_01190 [Vulcanimicrobiaceae bacterium]
MRDDRSKTRVAAGKILREIPYMLVDAHAANAYMPPRNTRDVDMLVQDSDFPKVEQRLREAGWSKNRNLMFPNAKLGLFGSAWHHDKTDDEMDVLSSNQSWMAEAFTRTPVYDRNGARVIPLPFIIFMKIDSARATDQGDLARMLGRLADSEVETIIKTIGRYYDDPQAPDDVRQYAAVGRWEYESVPDKDLNWRGDK